MKNCSKYCPQFSGIFGQEDRSIFSWYALFEQRKYGETLFDLIIPGVIDLKIVLQNIDK